MTGKGAHATAEILPEAAIISQVQDKQKVPAADPARQDSWH